MIASWCPVPQEPIVTMGAFSDQSRSKSAPSTPGEHARRKDGRPNTGADVPEAALRPSPPTSPEKSAQLLDASTGPSAGPCHTETSDRLPPGKPTAQPLRADVKDRPARRTGLGLGWAS